MWELEELDEKVRGVVRSLQEVWQEVRREGEALLEARGLWNEDRPLVAEGRWRELQVVGGGVGVVPAVCSLAPTTCSLVSSLDLLHCPLCTTKWSLLAPGTRVKPHCAPTNRRLRIHLGLRVPEEGVAMQLAGSRMGWREGEVVVFDDSFEHQVWNNSTEARLIFILDIQHPNLNVKSKSS